MTLGVYCCHLLLQKRPHCTEIGYDVSKFPHYDAETLIRVSFRTMSVRSGGDLPGEIQSLNTLFRVPMETVHVILVAAGPLDCPWDSSHTAIVILPYLRKYLEF